MASSSRTTRTSAPPEGCTHIVGAGLAGLSAAVRLSESGRLVHLYEAGPAAGGRCRSFLDRGLGVRIDNGNHLVLAANHATMAYLAAIGARGELIGPQPASYPFVDLANGEHWTLALNPGRFPWWILHGESRVKGSRLRDYFSIAKLFWAAPDASVSEAVGAGILARRLLAPLATAALNTPPEVGSARLFARVLRKTLGGGGAACAPYLPRTGLSETFVDPALSWLRERGASIAFGQRVRALEITGGRVSGLVFADRAEHEEVGSDESVVLAVPAPVATNLVPGIVAPLAFAAILNVHYRLAVSDAPKFIAVLGGLTQWVFVKRDVVSVTVSAANEVIDRPARALAEAIWSEVATVLGVDAPMPPARVVKERRATFAASPAEERRRPPQRTAIANLTLAGDWTATGLPGTIEGAIRSGEEAASIVCGCGRNPWYRVRH